MRTGPSRQITVLGLLLASSLSVVAQAASVRVSEGELLGIAAGTVTAYLGVPYAAPPVGENRWKPPQAAARWQRQRDATRFPASCQQKLTPYGFGPWTQEYVVNGRISEDCLYLNVWTPARSSRERLPVLFWIHGGGFSSGSGSVPIYNGAALAAHGIIVVNANYRLGVYGFLAHPALTAESPAHASGNYGLLDQVAALRWIQANIDAFGGDPSRVTIAGQSAGAASVHLLIASPSAKGLFSQAIAQSGSGMGLPLPGREVAEATGQALSDIEGARLSLDQLRALSVADLDARVAKLPPPGGLGLRFIPSVDGIFLRDAEQAQRNTNDTAILTGMTANEITDINPKFMETTATGFSDQLANTYGSLAPKVAALYPATTDQEAVSAFLAHTHDRGLAAMYYWAKDRLRRTRHPIYAYLWTHSEPGPDAVRYKAFHSSEMPYVFDTLGAAKRPFTHQDFALAEMMSHYWLNFVKSGDPNGRSLRRWPRFTSTDKRIMELGTRTAPRLILPPGTTSVFEQYANNGGQLGLFN